MKQVLFSLLAISILASCSDDDEKAIALSGEWEWVSTVGGFAGQTFTPETEGYEQTLQLNGKKASSFVNDSLVVESKYMAGARPYSSDPSSDSFCYVRFERAPFLRRGSTLEFRVEEEGGEIILIEECADCYSHIFHKK